MDFDPRSTDSAIGGATLPTSRGSGTQELAKGPEITTTLKRIDGLPLARHMNLKGVAIGTGPGGWSPEVAYSSRIFIETFTKSTSSWKEHLDLRASMRNLLRVAAWRPINFQTHRVVSVSEDANRKGNVHHQWREVRTASTGIAEGVWAPRDQFLFHFSDIGTRGILRWLKARRTIGPY